MYFSCMEFKQFRTDKNNKIMMLMREYFYNPVREFGLRIFIKCSYYYVSRTATVYEYISPYNHENTFIRKLRG